MADNQNIVNNLISGKEFKDSRLASLLQMMANDLYGLERQVNPPQSVSRNLNPGGNVVTVAAPTGFMVTVFTNNIRLSWDRPATGLFLYELRLGNDYDTATILLTTATLSADIDPVSRFIVTNATYTFWLTAIDNSGNRSDSVSVSVTIPAIGAPTLTASAISNNALVYWTPPSSTFTIAYYNLYKDSVLVGTTGGTFNIFSELVGGTYEYGVQAVDIVGNLGAVGTISVIVTNSPDSTILTSISSIFDGLKSYCVIDLDGTLFCCINDTQTWEEHFTENSWASPQAQVDASFPLYFQPARSHGGDLNFNNVFTANTYAHNFDPSTGANFTTTTDDPIVGRYQEVFDFGSVEDNVAVSLSFTTIRIVNSGVSILTYMEGSTDGITYSSPTTGTSQFFSSLRYCRVTLVLSPFSNLSSLNISGLRADLNVNTQTDGGTVTANSGDVGGTVVNFNKTFRQVTSITLTSQSTTAAVMTYDFSFAPGLTSFKVLCFNDAGTRITKDISWAARGIV